MRLDRYFKSNPEKPLEEQLESLILMLSDGRPDRDRYRLVVRTVGYELSRWKAREIQNSSSARNPAAVFFAWAMRQTISHHD